MVKYLHGRGAQLHLLTKDGSYTTLMATAMNGQTEVVYSHCFSLTHTHTHSLSLSLSLSLSIYLSLSLSISISLSLSYRDHLP